MSAWVLRWHTVALANTDKGGQADADLCRPELPALQNSSTQGRSPRAATRSRHSPCAAANSACSTRLPPPALPCRDYNQKHFVRSGGFQQAADKLQGPTRRIFIEFLERSCTAGGWVKLAVAVGVAVARECMAGQVGAWLGGECWCWCRQTALSTGIPHRPPLPSTLAPPPLPNLQSSRPS